MKLRQVVETTRNVHMRKYVNDIFIRCFQQKTILYARRDSFTRKNIKLKFGQIVKNTQAGE